MHDLPRQKLRELILEYGRSLCDDPRRCEALLKDHCGEYKREIFVLVNALKNGIANDLLKAQSNGVPETIIWSRATQRLEDELAVSAEAAQWAVESWALTLDVVAQPKPIFKPEPKSNSTPTSTPLQCDHDDENKKSNPRQSNSTHHSSIHHISKTKNAKKNTFQNLLIISFLCVCFYFIFTAFQSRPQTLSARFIDEKDGTIIDSTTGLQWMRCSLGQEWDGATCNGEAKKYTLDEIVSLIDENKENKFSGWRLPSKKELSEIVFCSKEKKLTSCDRESCSPTIDQIAFPNSASSFYWSSSMVKKSEASPYVKRIAQIYDESNNRDYFVESIDFLFGSEVYAKYNNYPARLVKQANLSLISGRYRDNRNGTVTDITTGLQWMRCSLGQEWDGTSCQGQAKLYILKKARSKSEDYLYKDNYNWKDWRVPEIEELKTIIHCSEGRSAPVSKALSESVFYIAYKYIPREWGAHLKCTKDSKSPAIDIAAFPNSPLGKFWSKTTVAHRLFEDDEFAGVNFSDGSILLSEMEYYSNYVRLVRGDKIKSYK